MTRWKAEAEMTMAIFLRRPGAYRDLLAPTGAGPVLLLLGPLMWFGIVYLGSLLTLLWQSFTPLTTSPCRSPATDAGQPAGAVQPGQLRHHCAHPGDGAGVTLASAMLALPMAWYMARYTSGKMKAFFYIAVMLPMWASYIVKAYAWTLLLAKDGVAQWFLGHLGLEGAERAADVPAVGGNTLSTSGLGRFLVFVYIWLPFMILPVQAALERFRLVAAGLRRSRRGPRQTFRYVVLPLAIPALPPGRFSPFP
jgi:putative spermidine/putrescine transport system permease protein